MTVIDMLKRIQDINHLTNKQMANKIGIERESWLRIKRENKIGTLTLFKCLKPFPELKKSIYSHLTYDHLTRPETTQDVKRSLLKRFYVKYIKWIFYKGEGHGNG